MLTRRTRISVDTSHRGRDSTQAVAELIAPELGWTPDDVEREVQQYRRRVEQEIASHRVEDEERAQAVRLEAPEARTLVTGGSRSGR